jgi:hypothetical protein
MVADHLPDGNHRRFVAELVGEFCGRPIADPLPR